MRLQWVTLTIIALNVGIYLIGLIGWPDHYGTNFATIAFGHVPSVINDLKTLPAQYAVVPDDFYWVTAITGAFLHADIWHLGGNMLFIWVFGDNVEDAMGHFKFAIFYLLCAFAGSWFHAFSFPASDAALIGASGAAAGIIAAYLMLHPKVWVWVLFAARIPLRLPAWTVLGFWLGMQVWMYVMSSDGEISWAAHVGGGLTGIVLTPILKRWAVPLFDREVIVPGAVVLKEDADLPPKVEPPRWGRGAVAKSN
ncbi:rhomboid family intramembrane serine protease [Ahrensia sp. R2A130]|uniref:rhomboid family intramembrane serine protease n=1 Tax=Ahrensia sp. R2A130 TaxID=744979 RepID=UPI0001E0F0FB|nr:rhomboid family protein [Ahrensia sp. R2A130]